MTTGAPATIATNTLSYFHNNPRRGDVDAIAESLQAHGQFRPIVVNTGTHTGRPNEVLAGNHTLMACRRLAEQEPGKWEQIDAWVVDVDDDAAARIVLADNRTGDLSEYDDMQLLGLLRQIEGNTHGTGYEDDDIDDLVALEEELETEHPTEPPSAPQGSATPGDHTHAQPTPPEAPHGHTGPEDTGTRMFAIHFPLDQFVWAQNALSTWHQDHPEAEGAHALAIHTLLTQHTTP